MSIWRRPAPWTDRTAQVRSRGPAAHHGGTRREAKVAVPAGTANTSGWARCPVFSLTAYSCTEETRATSHPALIPHEVAVSSRVDPLIPIAQGSKRPARAGNPRHPRVGRKCQDRHCHAGGRGFESRRSRLPKCLQMSDSCCRHRRVFSLSWPIRGPGLIAQITCKSGVSMQKVVTGRTN